MKSISLYKPDVMFLKMYPSLSTMTGISTSQVIFSNSLKPTTRCFFHCQLKEQVSQKWIFYYKQCELEVTQIKYSTLSIIIYFLESAISDTFLPFFKSFSNPEWHMKQSAVKCTQ